MEKSSDFIWHVRKAIREILEFGKGFSLFIKKKKRTSGFTPYSVGQMLV
jgi:hypothetical protein